MPRSIPSPTTQAASSRPAARGRALPAVALALCLAALAAGCATVQVTQPDAPGVADTPAQVEQRVARWQFDAGNRPPADRDGYRPPLKLAVLLPLTGSLATAAAPVRDGLLAGYYGEQRQRPELVFYDTAGTAAGAGAAYARAVAEGADQAVGPLGRDEIEAVYRALQPSTPVVALNHAPSLPPPNSASFALAPEDDGTGAADFLVSRGAKRVLVLAGEGDYARRSVASFGKRLQEQQGTVAQILAIVGDKPADQTPVLQAAAEAGVDAVFMALRGPQARAVAPQLAAAGLAAKPRVATSLLTSGTGKAEEDRALDGIAFPTDSWSVGGVRTLPPAGLTGQRLPTARGGAAKLFAFGYDAWLLTAYLEKLALADDASVEGATGVLRIGADGNVVRTPAWSSFSNGVVVPLAGAAH